jgi:hypothetical protein
MRNTTTKIKRDMKKYIVLSLALFATDLFSDNSQELQSHFKNSDVNFRDSDGDGMTDYAELILSQPTLRDCYFLFLM